MGDVVNLKRFRKRAMQQEMAKEAEVNRVRFGRTKDERSQDEARAIRARETLDQHRLAPEDNQ